MEQALANLEPEHLDLYLLRHKLNANLTLIILCNSQTQ